MSESMFQPTDRKHGHAIREAVWALQLAGRPTPDKIKQLADFGREAWANDLPKVEDFQQTSFMLMPGQLPEGLQLPFSPGVSFQSFKSDGTLSWRVILDGNTLAVNCLDYESWDLAWPRARNYLAAGAKIFVDAKLPIAGATLQYINAFTWGGLPEKCDLSQLFRMDGSLLPHHFWNRDSQEWHHHQGWFDTYKEPLAGRVLRREHLTGQFEVHGGKRVATTLVDLFARYDFTVRETSSAFFFEKHAERTFPFLRGLLRRSLRTYLTDEMLERIKAHELRFE